jgi:hypothetical protein
MCMTYDPNWTQEERRTVMATSRMFFPECPCPGCGRVLPDDIPHGFQPHSNDCLFLQVVSDYGRATGVKASGH